MQIMKKQIKYLEYLKMFKINNINFKILNKYKEFMNKVDNVLENVPRKDMYYKDKLKEVLDELLNYILKSSYELKIDKLEDYRVNIKSYIAMIDFMLDRLYDKKYVSEKSTYRLGNDLIEINKMVTGWLNGKLNVNSKIK